MQNTTSGYVCDRFVAMFDIISLHWQIKQHLKLNTIKLGHQSLHSRTYRKNRNFAFIEAESENQVWRKKHFSTASYKITKYRELPDDIKRINERNLKCFRKRSKRILQLKSSSQSFKLVKSIFISQTYPYLLIYFHVTFQFREKSHYRFIRIPKKCQYNNDNNNDNNNL